MYSDNNTHFNIHRAHYHLVELHKCTYCVIIIYTFFLNISEVVK